MKVKLNIIYILIFIVILNCKITGQIYTVEGYLSAENEPVADALISFTDNSDTSKIYVCNSDSLGYYKIDILTSVGKTEVLPKNIELHQNYPNPFSRNTSIKYSINRTAETEIRIYDILGREIKKFIFGNQGKGYFGINWDGTDNNGNIVASGVYIYVLQNGNERISKKMIVTNGAESNYHFGAISSNSKYVAENISKTNNSFTILVQSLEDTTPQIVKQIATEQVIDDNTIINFELEKARILLYRSIDGVKIGDDSLTVIQKLGEPSDIRPAGDCECYAFYYFEFPYDIFRISFLKNAPRDSIYSVVDLRVYNNYEGKFTEGIGLGYSRDEVLRVLGEPITSSTIGIDDVYRIETPYPGYLKTFTQLRYNESSVLQEIIMGY